MAMRTLFWAGGLRTQWGWSLCLLPAIINDGRSYSYGSAISQLLVFQELQCQAFLDLRSPLNLRFKGEKRLHNPEIYIKQEPQMAMPTESGQAHKERKEGDEAIENGGVCDKLECVPIKGWGQLQSQPSSLLKSWDN